MSARKSKSQSKGSPPKARRFEEELSRLEEAVDRLEGGELTLEQAIDCYEKAFHSWKNCAGILRSAQKRIETLCEDLAEELGGDPGEEGSVSWKPFPLKTLSRLEGREEETEFEANDLEASEDES